MLFMVAAWLCACSIAQPQPTKTVEPGPPLYLPSLALINGTLIDGTGSEPVPEAVVLIQNGKILLAGPSSEVTIPDGFEIIDVQGATILPGFINAHVHGAYNLEKLRTWASEGVTTVRDLGAGSWPAPFHIRDQAALDPQYARLVSGGVMITAPKGYPIAVFGAPGIEVDSPELARQAVLDELSEGVDVIKVALESGKIFGQTIPILTPEEFSAIVQTAHERNVLVTVHVTITKDLRLALDGNVDDIAHMVTDPLPDELVKSMVSSGTYWTPTLELWKKVGQGMDLYTLKNLEKFVKAGGKVALGTDFEGYSTPFQLGMPTIEVELMSQAGMTPMQIIVSATKNAAYVCGMGDSLGTLEPNKIADILVVQGNPLQDLQALARPLWVIHNGVIIHSPVQ